MATKHPSTGSEPFSTLQAVLVIMTPAWIILAALLHAAVFGEA